MVQHFTTYNAEQHLLLPTDRILAAVSGGVDSMTLLWLLLQANYKVAVAHCNFALRGAESDGDEHFVSDFAKKYNLPCFTRRFDTAAYASKNKLSIQMAARELRYQWFAQLADTQGFTKIAIAHNANDAVETFFLHLTRGTGLQGLTGMAAKQEKIVRPLLFATRPQIVAYAQSQRIVFREDSSNSSTKYTRNYIRHKVVPALQEINPAFLLTMQQNLAHLAQSNKI